MELLSQQLREAQQRIESFETSGAFNAQQRAFFNYLKHTYSRLMNATPFLCPADKRRIEEILNEVPKMMSSNGG